MVRLGFTSDLVTDQTSAHDPLWGYLPPPRRPDEEPEYFALFDPQAYVGRIRLLMAQHVQAILGGDEARGIAFDYGKTWH